MTTSSLRRKTAVFLVAAFLLLPWASAAEPRGRIELNGFLARIWRTLTAVWSQAGCSIDPYGGGCSFGSPDSPDEGCSADPYGRCLQAPTADEGCSIDPYGGGCRSGN